MTFRIKFLILALIVGILIILILEPASITIAPIWRYFIFVLAVLVSFVIFTIPERLRKKGAKS